jgi:uncharacterized protein YdeI (YjbR/CyaY-like superfamily)
VATRPVTFRSSGAFRTWLESNHAAATELVVRCFKVHASDRGITYAQALDEALCYGWIDGVRHGLDADSFTVRFTPRKARSIWSRVNVAHAQRLIEAGRMAKPGLAAFEAREDSRTGIYSFEQRSADLPPEYEQAFRTNKTAWAYFREQPPWYRRTSIYWVMSAKREETRAARLATLVACSAQRKPIPPLDRSHAGRSAGNPTRSA